MRDINRREQGRTMTEMLGVLVVIAVLSVGGMMLGEGVVGGIKANRVVSGLQERILLAQQRRIIGQSLSFRERRIEESIMGVYSVEYENGITDESIPIYYGKKITVSAVPEQVCEGLKKSPLLQETLDEAGGIISFNNGGEDGVCVEGNNTFFVLFGGRNEGKCRGINNGCMVCDEATGDWVVDESKEGEQIQDICHMCSNGNIVEKEKGQVIPCGNECCSPFEACDETLGCVTQCPPNSSLNYFEGDQIPASDCFCNKGYRLDAFQTGCWMDCGVHGTLSNDICICQDDYYGDHCENAPLNCENGGTWNNQTNSCDCVGTYGGFVCADRVCETNNDCEAFLGSAYKCNTEKGICEIQCASNQTYVDNFGCCRNDALWNGGCCYTRSGYDMQEIDGIKMCCNGNTCCPEGQIYDNKTKTCINCADVTGVIQNALFNRCNMCPNLVRVSKWQCAPTCTDPDAVLVNGICICPLEKPLLPSNNPANPKCLPCDYDGRTSSDSAYGNINTGYYCNRKNGGGYSDYCAPGTVGVSRDQTITLADGTTYKETTSYGSCKPCSEVDVSALEYQASCESCGGTWVGDSWDNGTCQP